jgi:hypothetical protein
MSKEAAELGKGSVPASDGAEAGDLSLLATGYHPELERAHWWKALARLVAWRNSFYVVPCTTDVAPFYAGYARMPKR